MNCDNNEFKKKCATLIKKKKKSIKAVQAGQGKYHDLQNIILQIIVPNITNYSTIYLQFIKPQKKAVKL